MSDPEGASPPSTRRPKLERHLSLTRRRAREEKAADDSRAYAEWIKAVLRLATQLQTEKHQEDGFGKEKQAVSNRESLTTYYIHKDLNILQDLRNGSLLILLTEAVTGEKLHLGKGEISPKCLDNIQVALQCLEKFGVRLIGITKNNIYAGDQTATLGLIWKMMKLYQGKRMGRKLPPPDSQRQHLLYWCQRNLMKYKSLGIEVTDFGPSWKDGLAFIGLLHHFKPDKVNIEDMKKLSPIVRLEDAFTMAKEEYGVDQFLLPQDLQFLPDKGRDDSGPRKKTKHLDDPHVLTYIFELYKQIVKQFPDMPDSQLIDEQPTMLAEAESDSAEQTAEYTEKALLLREWLEDVNNKQHKIADKDLADEEDRKVLQAILHEEDMRRHDLTSLEECFIVLSHNPHASSRIEDDLRPVNITRQFDGSLRAVRLCLVTVMLNEADEMLSRGNGVVGDRKKFEDALEEQEQFFAENNHLENAKGILNEVQDSNVSETQRDINSQTKVLRQQMDSISFKEPQVHSRLTSGIAAWKQYGVHYTDLELGADQCKKRLDEFQGTPMATSPQEVADGITQLNNICENNNQLFSKAGALREQVDLLAAFATSEQRTSISNDARVLSDSLEKTSTTIKDLKNTLQEQLIKDWEQRINNLDAKLIRLPAVEYDMKCLSALSESIEAIADEFSICRRELDSLKKAAMDIEGFFNDSGTEQLQALDSHLDKFAANVAGKRAEIAASARMTEKVAKMLNDVENELKAVSSNIEDDLQDQVGVLELSAVQDHFNNLQTCCQQLQELLPKLEDSLKPFPVRGGPSTKALEMRAEALSSQIENAVNRASSQLETLTDIRDKLSQMEVETNGLSSWADKANETLALGSVPLTQLEELESEVEEKKPLFSGINATANDLTATYPSLDNQYLSNSMLAVRTKLQKVQDTLVAKHREQSSWKISCLDVLTFLVVVVSAAVG